MKGRDDAGGRLRRTIDRCDSRFLLLKISAAKKPDETSMNIPDCGKKKSLTILSQLLLAITIMLWTWQHPRNVIRHSGGGSRGEDSESMMHGSSAIFPWRTDRVAALTLTPIHILHRRSSDARSAIQTGGELLAVTGGSSAGTKTQKN